MYCPIGLEEKEWKSAGFIATAINDDEKLKNSIKALSQYVGSPLRNIVFTSSEGHALDLLMETERPPIVQRNPSVKRKAKPQSIPTYYAPVYHAPITLDQTQADEGMSDERVKDLTPLHIKIWEAWKLIDDIGGHKKMLYLYDLILDESSYQNTVENLLRTSFLLREKKISLDMIEYSAIAKKSKSIMIVDCAPGPEDDKNYSSVFHVKDSDRHRSKHEKTFTLSSGMNRMMFDQLRKVYRMRLEYAQSKRNIDYISKTLLKLNYFPLPMEK